MINRFIFLIFKTIHDIVIIFYNILEIYFNKNFQKKMYRKVSLSQTRCEYKNHDSTKLLYYGMNI